MTFDELWGRSTPNSWARVPRGPAAVAVGAFLFGTTGVLATTTIAGVSLATIGGFLVTTAITTWALSALAPKPEQPVRNSLGNIKEATGPFDIVYGEVRKGGVITFMETSDRISNGNRYENDYLHMVIVLAGHEVEEIGDIFLNDERVTLNADGYVTSGRWAEISQVIRVKKMLGTPNQLAQPNLLAETSITSDFRGRGIAYIYVRMDWDKDVFANGTPTVTAMVKGKKVFDPRTNTTAWTDNAALCIRDYLSEDYGVNSKQSPTSLSSPSWVTGANVCDTLVTRRNGTTEKRYTLNGILSTNNTPRANLQKMLTSCGGTLFWGQGCWQFKAGYLPAAPYVSFTADDLRSGINLVTKNSRKENFNSVTGVFVNANRRFIEMEYPKVRSPVFLARDNGQDNVLDMSLPMTTSPSAAQRLGKMALFRSREEIIISADFGLKAANVKVGDVIRFTFSRYGFSNKLFEVISWKPSADGGELTINLLLKETSAAAYDWNAEESDIIDNNTTLPNPTAGLTVSGLIVTNRQTLQSDGTFLGEVVLSWNRAQSAFIDRYNVQWKRVTDINWSSTTTDEISIVLPSIQSGVAYTFRVQAVSLAGFAGPWEQIGATLPGKNTPPGVPTAFTATNRYRAAELNWTNPTDPDLNHVVIYTNTTNSTTGLTKVGESGGTKFVYDMEPMESRWFFLRARDHSGNFSAYTPGRQATALFVEPSDVDIDVKELLDDAGLSAVEVLSALPTVGNFVGRTVYLTTDQQLYSWNGTEWVKAVKTGEDILTALNFPQGLRPIEIVASLPTTGNFVGRVVLLTTDNKLYRRTATAWTASVPAADIGGQITTTQIGPNSVDTAQINADAITAGKIRAGAVTADKILANSIGASKLFVSDFTNLVPDSDILDLEAWSNQNPSQFSVEVSGPFAKSTNWVRSNFSGTVTGSFVSRNFSVEVGKEYYASIQARKASSSNSVSLFARVNFYDATGAYLSSATIRNSSIDVDLTEYSTSFVVPANTATTRFLWSFGSSSTGTALVGGAAVRRKNGGELIVDGAIQAQHMTANSVTAGVIAAGAISTSALLVDGIITASKLNTNSLGVAGLAVFGGRLESSNYNAATGVGWAINQDGGLNVPNASIGNAKIANLSVNTIKIADESVTTYPFAFSAGSLSIPNGTWTTLQSLTLTRGRSTPMPINMRFDFAGGDTGGTINFRLIRTDLSETIWSQNSFGGTNGHATAVDANVSTGPVTYRLQVYSTGAASLFISNRFLGCLNAYK